MTPSTEFVPAFQTYKALEYKEFGLRIELESGVPEDLFITKVLYSIIAGASNSQQRLRDIGLSGIGKNAQLRVLVTEDKDWYKKQFPSSLTQHSPIMGFIKKGNFIIYIESGYLDKMSALGDSYVDAQAHEFQHIAVPKLLGVKRDRLNAFWGWTGSEGFAVLLNNQRADSRSLTKIAHELFNGNFPDDIKMTKEIRKKYYTMDKQPLLKHFYYQYAATLMLIIDRFVQSGKNASMEAHYKRGKGIAQVLNEYDFEHDSRTLFEFIQEEYGLNCKFMENQLQRIIFKTSSS